MAKRNFNAVGGGKKMLEYGRAQGMGAFKNHPKRKEPTKMTLRTCAECGAHLDPGESCPDCVAAAFEAAYAEQYEATITRLASEGEDPKEAIAKAHDAAMEHAKDIARIKRKDCER